LSAVGGLAVGTIRIWLMVSIWDKIDTLESTSRLLVYVCWVKWKALLLVHGYIVGLGLGVDLAILVMYDFTVSIHALVFVVTVNLHLGRDRRPDFWTGILGYSSIKLRE
jgi:hypothetical protein